jgi:hypothetical protein
MSTPTTFAVQIAPQRSTQYSDLVGDLAVAEVAASPLRHRAADVALRGIAGQDYVTFTLQGPLSEEDRTLLASLATLGNVFELFDGLAGVEGPLLRPVAVAYPHALSPDIASVRRYKGKTNELFTLFLCNVAKFASAFAETPWRDLRVFDPLSGGGTTLFTALSLGANAAGVERERGDAESTATFLTQFCRESRVSVSVREERLRLIGAHRWQIRVGREKEDPRRCLIAAGDSAQSRDLLAGFGRPHLVVTDLPYGIQHDAPLADLLSRCLPVWAASIEPGGALAFSWDSTRANRDEMAELVEGLSPLRVVRDAPYGDLAHRVDRVIKRRDVIVARAG